MFHNDSGRIVNVGNGFLKTKKDKIPALLVLFLYVR